MSTAEIANKLSAPQRTILLRHCNGPQPVDLTIGTGGQNVRRTVCTLISSRLLRHDDDHRARPKNTVLTDLGRETACWLLGLYADALVEAGLLQRMPEISLAPLVELQRPRALIDS